MTLVDRGSMHHLQVHITSTFWYYGSYADLQMFAYSFLSGTFNDGMLLDQQDISKFELVYGKLEEFLCDCCKVLHYALDTVKAYH